MYEANETSDSCYKYVSELSGLRHKIFSVKKEIDDLKRQQKLQSFNEKLNHLAEIYQTTITGLENIADKKDKAFVKAKEMSLTKSNTLPLPWSCYEDVLNLFADIKKLKAILEDPSLHLEDTEDEFDQYLQKLQSALHILHSQVVEGEKILLESKEFVENMAKLTTEDVDLGCYPHEQSDEVENDKNSEVPVQSHDLYLHAPEDGDQSNEEINGSFEGQAVCPAFNQMETTSESTIGSLQNTIKRAEVLGTTYI